MLRYFTATLTFPSERSASKARPSNPLSLRSAFGRPLPLLKRGGNSSYASKPFAELRSCVPFLVENHPDPLFMTMLIPPNNPAVRSQTLPRRPSLLMQAVGSPEHSALPN